jgi:uncharacterized protein with NAD-binding domain and iron-sulfur cluster
MPAKHSVAIFGGGVGGLSAAHELAERGFAVTVYERNAAFGGKARSLSIVSTQITPGRSANHGVCQAAHFYVIKQPQTCSVLRDNSQGQ